MGELKKSDAEEREELKRLYQDVTDVLTKIGHVDTIVQRQLEKEGTTNDYQRKILKHRTILSQGECPVVVAGKPCN